MSFSGTPLRASLGLPQRTQPPSFHTPRSQKRRVFQSRHTNEELDYGVPSARALDMNVLNRESQLLSASRSHHRTSTASSRLTPARRFLKGALNLDVDRRQAKRTPSFLRYRSNSAMDYDDDDDDGDDDNNSSSSHFDSSARFEGEESVSASSGARYTFSHDAGREMDQATEQAFKTPERPFRSANRFGIRQNRGSPSASYRSYDKPEAAGLDEDLITKTPAKGENDQWLESLGFDLALLKLTSSANEGIENQDPNLPHSKPSTEQRIAKYASYKEAHSPKRYESDYLTNTAQNYDVTGDQNSTFFSASSPAESMESSVMPPEASMDDWTEERSEVDTERMMSPVIEEDLPRMHTPSRVSSTRKGRRASARVSARELRGLFGSQDGKEDNPEVAVQPSPAKRRARYSILNLEDAPPSRTDAGEEKIDGGAAVVLSKVRATRQQKEELGTDSIVTPVRRSLRLSQKRNPVVKFADVGELNAERLQAADYAYVPNHSIVDRIDRESTKTLP